MVMKLHQVQYWFFTSKVNGQILKKRRANSNAREILEAWGKKIRKHPCDLFAYTMHSEEMDGGTHGIHQDHREGKTTVEGHSFATLRELFKGKKHSNGIVQRFVLPKGGKNTVIKAAWSPSMCLVERRVNVHGVTDKRAPMGDRLVTFEGPEHLSESMPLAPAALLGRKVQFLCNSVAQHVLEVTQGHCRIASMVLHFKVDEDNKLWLLFCSSLRLAGRASGLARNSINLSPNFEVYQKKTTVIQGGKGTRSILVPELVECPGCSALCSLTTLCQVTFKAAIQAHRKAHRQPAASENQRVAFVARAGAGLGKVGGQGWEAPGPVPPLLLKVYGDISPASFRILQSDPTFLYRHADVCEKCCLEITSVSIADLETENPSAFPGPEGLGSRSPPAETVRSSGGLHFTPRVGFPGGRARRAIGGQPVLAPPAPARPLHGVGRPASAMGTRGRSVGRPCSPPRRPVTAQEGTRRSDVRGTKPTAYTMDDILSVYQIDRRELQSAQQRRPNRQPGGEDNASAADSAALLGSLSLGGAEEVGAELTQAEHDFLKSAVAGGA